ncbi:hypothetical protein [Aeromicrobium alkaliterrae]|uniref:Uncharacterized protein n=1 Tax=Aeromicrobium alkaliterrae TaxID=302168 RepID=A0ABP4W0G5_9ACTN
MSDPTGEGASGPHGEPQQIDWRRTFKVFLILTSPVTLLGLYMLGVKLFTLIAFRNFGE